jgi:hypothetical protein
VGDIDPAILANEELSRSGYIATSTESIAMNPNTTVSTNAVSAGPTVAPYLLSHIDTDPALIAKAAQRSIRHRSVLIGMAEYCVSGSPVRATSSLGRRFSTRARSACS